MDGFRLLSYRIGGETRLVSRNENELGTQFPEIVTSLATIDCDCVLDGELTVSDAEGKPDWHMLRPRSAMKRLESIERAAIERPAMLYLFDILARGKRDVRPASFASRRCALDDLIEPSEPVRVVGQWQTALRSSAPSLRTGSRVSSGRSSMHPTLRVARSGG